MKLWFLAVCIFLSKCLTVAFVLLMLVCFLVLQARGQSYTPLGTTVFTGTNGIVTMPQGFWTNNVVGAGDITITTNEHGRLVIGVVVDELADFVPTTLAEQYAADWADLHERMIERSDTVVTWTNGGGTYVTNAVVGVSPLLANGVASWDAEKTGPLQAVWEMSADAATWSGIAATNAAVYVRLSMENNPPAPPGDLTTTVSNVVVRSWTRPSLWGAVRDTAGQILGVDAAMDARAPVPLAQLQALLASVQAADWSMYPATQNVLMDGHALIMGSGWSVKQSGGFSAISYADLQSSEDGLVIANNGSPAISMTPGFAGLKIEGFVVSGGLAVFGVATNGVDAAPLIQWTEDLLWPDWDMVTPETNTWPGVDGDGHFGVTVTPPGEGGFFRAVRATGSDVLTLHASETKVEGALRLGGVSRSAWPSVFSGDYMELSNIPATFPPSVHTHAIGDVTGLQSALNLKADASVVSAHNTRIGVLEGYGDHNAAPYVQTNHTGDVSITGNLTAESYALTGNRLAIPTANARQSGQRLGTHGR